MAGNYTLGEAKGRITLETDFSDIEDAKKALADFEGYTKKTADGTANVDDALNKVSKTSAIAGGAIAAGFAVAVKTASDFEFQLSAIQAVSGATSEEMGKISDAALRIGKDTAYSAPEAALAMEELVKAGISVDDVLNGAADAAVALAAAGGVDLPTAATIAANAMNQFGLSADKLVGVTDTIAGAANASAIDVTDLGMAMSQVGAVANLIGLSFEDTSLAIAAMGNAGIKGSDAGTSLKTMLMNLQPTTAAAREEMERLGLITADGANQFFDQEGRIKSLTDISGVLETALAGMSEAQKTAALQTLFGSDAVRGAAIIANTGVAGFNDLSDAINKTSAADVAATRMDNLKGSIEQLKGGSETLAIQIGQRLIPVITDIVNKVSGFIDQFAGMSDGQQKAAIAAGLLAAGLLLGIAAITKAIVVANEVNTAYKALKTTSLAIAAAEKAKTVAVLAGAAASKVATAAQWLFNAALSANPIGIIIVAIAAVVAALIWFFTQTELGQTIWAEFSRFLGEAWANIVSVATTVFTALGDFFGTVWDGIVSIATTVFDTLKNLFLNFTPLGILISNIGPIAQFFQDTFNNVKSFVETAINGVIALFQFLSGVASTIFTAILTFIQPFVDWFQAYMVPLIQAAVGLVVAIVQYLWSAVVLAFTTANNILLGIMTAITNFFISVWNAVAGVITSVVTTIVSFLTTAFQAIYNVVSSVLSTVFGVVSSIWSAISSFISGVVSDVVSFIKSVWSTIVAIVSGVLSSVLATVTNIWNAVVNFIKSAVTNAVNTVRSVFGTVVGVVSSAFSGVVSAVQGPFNQVLSFIQGIQAKIQAIFSGAASWLVNAGKNIIQGLINGIENMISSLTSKLNFITNLIPESKGPERVDKVLLQDNGEMIMQSLINGFANKTGDLTSFLRGITTSIPLDVNSSISATSAAGSDGGTTTIDNRKTFNVKTDENPVLWARAVGREYEDASIGSGR